LYFHQCTHFIILFSFYFDLINLFNLMEYFKFWLFNKISNIKEKLIGENKFCFQEEYNFPCLYMHMLRLRGLVQVSRSNRCETYYFAARSVVFIPRECRLSLRGLLRYQRSEFRYQ